MFPPGAPNPIATEVVVDRKGKHLKGNEDTTTSGR